jgi:hypothetical protein
MTLWASTKVGAYLRLNRNVKLDLHAAAIAFELNAIPRAEFHIAAGRDAGSGAASSAHLINDLLQAETPVQLILDARYIAAAAVGLTGHERVPEGEQEIFDGYVSGVATTQTGAGLSFVLQATHWLADMAHASALSQNSHPNNPGAFTYQAMHNLLGAGTGTSFTPFDKQGLITDSVIKTDLWGAGLLPWLQEVAGQDFINIDELTFLNQASPGTAAALAALNRFTTTSGNYVPLQLRTGAADASSIAAAIYVDVQKETYESFANTTLWDKLVQGFAPKYMFAVVPRVNDALVVPYVPGLKQAWKHVVRAADYDPIRTISPRERAVAAVGVFSGLSNRTGADGHIPGSAEEAMTRAGIGGWYRGADRGLILLRQAPPWLSNISSPERYGEWGSGAGKYPVGSAAHPTGGVLAPGAKPPAPEVLAATTKRMLDRYAQALYAYEHLRGRQADVVCRPRFDIAPGSTVRVQRHGDQFVKAALGGFTDDTAEDLIGDVIRVTHHISRDPPKFETVLTLAHIRTQSEQDKPGGYVDGHPLWEKSWPGAGLLPEFD